jgi:hypothetical protein
MLHESTESTTFPPTLTCNYVLAFCVGTEKLENEIFEHKSNLRQKYRFVALWLSEWDFDGLGLFDMCKTATIYQLTPLPRFGHYQFPLQSVKDFWHISRLFQTLSSCLHR